VLHVLLSPLGLGLLILVLRHVLIKQGWRNTGWVTTPTLLVCFGLLTPLGANTLVQTLEQDSAPAPACSQDASRPLVLLSGGLDRSPSNESDIGALTPSSSRRLYALLQHKLITPGRPLIISGGNAAQGIPESRVLRQLAIFGQVSPDQIITEERSTSTWDNATQTASLLLPKQPGIALVTSARHMKRAREAFERQGFDVCPVPVDFVYVPPGGLGYLLPQSFALIKSEQAIHEWLGVLVYKLRARQGR
jgi:uncharacterized SAM-binding protein YcdF (DUF218 family)